MSLTVVNCVSTFSTNTSGIRLGTLKDIISRLLLIVLSPFFISL